MKVSIIIPTYNEAEHIGSLVRYLFSCNNGSISKIIVCDGGSTDDTVSVAKNAGADVLISPNKGRAFQMNYGASHARGEVFYFIHADCRPPNTFLDDISNAISKQCNLGRYRTKFDSNKGILKINAWFTQFDFFICMGGDQTLFVERQLFEKCRGFKEDLLIMEEYEFCERARKLGDYTIMNGTTLVSARKYKHISWLRVQLANSKIVSMYKKGASQLAMVEMYKKMLS